MGRAHNAAMIKKGIVLIFIIVLSPFVTMGTLLSPRIWVSKREDIPLFLARPV
jgi:hypothetical protein